MTYNVFGGTLNIAQLNSIYIRRHISTSGWAQNAAKRAQHESVGKIHTTISP